MMADEIQPDSYGAGFVRTILDRSVGRTIESISFSAPNGEDGNERLEFRFTDGSVLTMIDPSFVVTFDEAPSK